MSDNEAGPSGAGGDEDVSLPKATVAKAVSEYLPAGMTASKESKELMAELAKEFIVLISSEAHEICEKGSKKTIAPEHIVEALKQLGFDKYVEEVEEASKDHKQVAKERAKKSSSKFNVQGLTEEELNEQQEALFAASARRYQNAADQSGASTSQAPSLAATAPPPTEAPDAS